MGRYLPLELVMEVLRRLPVRARTKFRCVCKSWFSIISQLPLQRNPTLLVRSYPHAGNHETTLFSSYDMEGNLLKQFVKKFHDVIRLEISCLDFVSIIDGQYNLFLCNPTTEQLIALPKNDIRIAYTKLGYAPLSKKFKVLGICFNDKHFDCMVFTLGLDCSWRATKDAPIDGILKDAVFNNGAIHALVWSSSYRLSIGDFDLEQEKWGQFVYLDFLGLYNHRPIEFVVLSEVKGSLCLMVFIDEDEKQNIDLWLMKDTEWTKECSMDLRTIVKSYTTNCDSRLLIVDDNGSLLLILTIDDKVFIVNCTTGRVNEVKSRESAVNGRYSLYVESILSLGGS